MRDIGLYVPYDQELPVKLIKGFWIALEEIDGEQRFVGHGAFALLESLFAAEIREPAGGGDTRPGEEHDAPAFVDP